MSSLIIDFNVKLQSVSGLSGLSQITHYLDFFDNGQLPTCAAERLAAFLGPDASPASIVGNDDEGVCAP